MEIEKGKLIRGVSYEDYNAIEALRSGDFKPMKKSPAHWKAKKNNPEEKVSDALLTGNAFHNLVELKDKFTYLVEPEVNKRTNAGKEELAEFYANLPKGTTVLKPEWVPMFNGMLESLLSHSAAKHLLSNGISETSLVVKDPNTGILLKCRPDHIMETGHLLDIKTTRDASRSFFLGQIFSDRGYSPFYVLQAAHYVHCLKVAGISKSDAMTFIAIEKEPPYGIMIYPLDIGCIAVGEQWRAKLTEQYAKCLEEDSWPCYEEKIMPVTPPQWSSVPDMDEIE
jgi:exodeoxyribonuclease VIII